AVVWWTDRARRRHVRVVGQRDTQPTKGRVARVWSDEGPALALVYPGPFFRTRRGKRELVCLCACGAWGAPEEVGWLGESCGPCHDRAEAGEGAPAGRQAWFHDGLDKQVRSLALSPDDATLATTGLDDRLRLWDADTGALKMTSERAVWDLHLNWSPD